MLLPDIDAANVMYKTLTYTSESRNGGLLVGAAAPVILTSRADSFETKTYSIALGAWQQKKIIKEKRSNMAYKLLIINPDQLQQNQIYEDEIQFCGNFKTCN